ncbi:MAG: hypothetical protein P1V51_19510 [Deltaproteobacteria bacterium]|nr:hypothetical protein [Deltaproteobacteria bacterium]
MKSIAWICALALALPLAAACGKKGAKGPEAGMEAAGGEDGDARLAGPGDWVKEYDLNRDDEPDVFHHYAKDADGTDRIVRKDLDINWDGRIDVLRWYDKKERVTKEDFDLDFDGKIDVTNFYDEAGKLIRKEADLDFNGRTDLWKHYEGGKLVRKERDTSGDGRVDYFEYYENGEIDRIGEDLDGDGTVDRWTKAQS